ncbi:hypothetical protein BDB01DRAFT_836543 [Pilobolus umbonatus]|nr:hypothetical protein BDB01DRAFT_836543 [Pilobolus umbonatus]
MCLLSAEYGDVNGKPYELNFNVDVLKNPDGVGRCDLGDGISLNGHNSASNNWNIDSVDKQYPFERRARCGLTILTTVMNDQAEYMIHRLLSVDSNTSNKLVNGFTRDEMECADECGINSSA